MNVKKLILASLIGTVAMFAAQAPKTESAPASKTTATAKKHTKKHHSKKATASNTNAKPAANK